MKYAIAGSVQHKGLLSSYKLVIFDIDGTILLSGKAVPKAAQLVEKLQNTGTCVAFMTNNTLYPSAQWETIIRGCGIPATPGSVYNPIRSLLADLTEKHKNKSTLILGSSSPRASLKENGIRVFSRKESEYADVVVVSFDKGLTYKNLSDAHKSIMNGAVFYATNKDTFCPDSNFGIPDTGAIVAALSASTGRSPDTIFGKPSGEFLSRLLDSYSVKPEETILIGDRLETDIEMALSSEITPVLVLSGATLRADVQSQCGFKVTDSITSLWNEEYES